MLFHASTHCRSNSHCKVCRATTEHGEMFRKGLQGRFTDISEMNFACPFNRPWNFDGIGDKVERAVKPIAKALGLPCYESGQLKPDSGCAKRRGLLNKLS